MVYLDLVMGLNFVVDLLLLMGTNGLSGFPASPGRSAAAAVLGGIYGGVCLLPGFRFLGNTVWRVIFLALMAMIAFGWNRSAIRRGAVFVLLSMALGGIAVGIGKGGMGAVIASAGGICLLCLLGFRDKIGTKKMLRVCLTRSGKKRCITALYDTGNHLRDPISGQPVMVVGAQIAGDLLGLTEEQLSAPVETMASAAIPGLRLIPYRAVGQPGGMLLAMRLDEVTVDGKEGNALVAFAPQRIGNEGYQALAGGIG